MANIDYGYDGDLTVLFPSVGSTLEICIPEHAEPGDVLTFRVLPAASHWKGSAICMLAPDGTARDNQLHANGGDKVAAMRAVARAKEIAAEKRAAYLKEQGEPVATDDDELAAL